MSQVAAASVLGSGELQLAGTEILVSPESQTVPLDLPTIVETEITGFDPALGSLPPGLEILGNLTGPEISGALVLRTAPNEPFRIPRFRLEGEYTLDNIRLVDGEEFLAWASPRTVTITVTQVLVTSVESRPLTYEEIESLGLVIDENRYQALHLTFGFAVAGQTLTYSMPVVYDLFGSGPEGMSLQAFPEINVPLPEFGGGTLPPSGRFRPQLVPFKLDLENPPPPEIPHGGCSFKDKQCRERFPPGPPMVGVILFPTDLRLLHQFFSVVLIVQNGAPEGDPLTLRDLSARIKLPAGLREAETTPTTPLGVPVPVRVPGADGELGTADDLSLIFAQARGEADFQVEGLKEGTHVVEFDLEGIVDGLPGGAQRIVGKAKGAVVVRDPNLGVTIHHPMTVRSGEEYPLIFTVSNTGNTLVNDLDVELPASSMSGAELVDPGSNVRTIGELAPGDSATVELRVRALRTGRVVSTSVKTGSQVQPHWEFSLGVGVGGVPLSPDTLVLPQASEFLPAGLREAALRVIGLGHSLSVTLESSLGEGLPRLSTSVVNERIYRLTQTGRHLELGEDVFDAVAVLAAELYGARDEDFDWNLLVQQVAGARGLASELGGVLRDEVGSVGELYERLAETTHFLEPQLALAEGSGATLEVASRLTGRRLAGDAESGEERVRELPFAELFGFADGELALLTAPEDDGYRVTLRQDGGGSPSLRVLVPSASGALRSLEWTNVALGPDGSATLEYEPSDTAFVLAIDANGDGFAESSLPATVEVLSPRPFEVLAVRQNAAVDPSGHVLDVLLSGDVDLESLWPRDPERFELPDNVSNGGLMPVEADVVAGILGGPTYENPFEDLFNSRLVRVVFSNPVSPLDSHTLTVRDLISTTGQALGQQTVPVETTASTNGIALEGRVIGPDGQPVPFAEVILRESDLSGIGNDVQCVEHVTAAAQADSGGYYRFPYVRGTACGDVFTVEGRDLVRHKIGVAKGRVRLIGTTQQLDVLMLGRGTIRGRVTYPDGSVPPGLEVLAENAVFDDGRRAHVDADGNYNVSDLAVGTIQMAAHDEQGRFAYATVELPVAGAVVEKDIVLQDLEEERWTGQLRGTVTGLDGEPSVDAWVALYVGGQLITTVRSDSDGDFDFGVVPATTDGDPATIDPGLTAEIEAFPTGSSVSGAQLFFEIHKDQVNQVALQMSDDRGTIQGHVYLRSVDGTITPLAGAPVWVLGLPFNTETDNLGFYRIEDVFAGHWRIKASDLSTGKQGSSEVTVGATGGVAVADVYFDEGLPEGGVTGLVVDYDGVTPVAGATVHLTGGVWAVRWYHEAVTDATGRFVIPGVGPGQGWVSAVYGDDGGLAPYTVRFPGDTPTVEVKFRKGTIRIRTVALQEDGSTAPVCSTTVGRFTRVVPKFGNIVAVNDKFETFFTCPIGEEATEEFLEIEALEGPYEFHVYNAFHGSRKISRYLGDGEIAEHVIEFEPNGSIGGVIYDRDGTPVEGATVEIASPPAPLYSNSGSGSFAAYDLETDSEGRFLFELVPKGEYDLTVTYDSGAIFRTERVRTRLTRAGEHLEVQMELPEQGSVIGWVQDGAGLPVAGAVVELAERAFPHRKLIHNADEDGNFAFHNVFVGDVAISAQAPSLGGLAVTRELAVEAENQDVYTVMTLQSVGEITGQVIYPGGLGPAAGSRVELHAGSFFDVVTADGNGEFRFRLLPIDTQFRVEAFDPSTGRFGKGSWVALDYHGQVQSTLVTLEARGEVHGTVIDGEIEEGLPATPVRLRSRGLNWFTVFATTDAVGELEFGGIPEGDFELAVQTGDAGRRRVAYENGYLAEEDEVVVVDLYLTPFAEIGGRVLAPPGAGAAGTLFDGEVNTWITAGDSLVVGASFDNPFDFSGIVPRQGYRLTAQEVGGSHRAQSGVVSVDENDPDGRIDVDLRMPAIGSTTIQVFDSSGDPVPGADVAVRNVHALGGESLAGNTGGDHRITFEGILEGAIQVSAVNPVTGLSGGNAAALSLEGEEVTIDVHLQPSGSVRGDVVLADGLTPAEGAIVSVWVGAWSKYFLITTDENGAFELDGLPLSALTLTVQEYFGPGSITRFASITSDGQVLDFGTLVLDDRDPFVLSIQPASGSRDVSESASATVTFSEPIDVARFQPSHIALESFSGAGVGVGFSWSADGTQVTIQPNAPLASATSYVLRVTRSTFDLAGRQLAWEQRSSFTTRDYIPPTVIDVVPRDGAVQVPVDANVEVRFSEPITDLVMPTFELYDVTDGSAVGQSAVPQRASELRYVLTPSQMVPDRLYRVDVSAAQDVAGNVMVGTVSTTFWTPDETPPEIAWVSPAVGSTYTAGDEIAAEATATDNRGIDRVEFQIGDWVFTSTSATSQFTQTLLAPVMTVAGDVEVTATAIDVFGNQASVTRTIWVEPHLNADPPVVDPGCWYDGDFVAPGLAPRLDTAISDDERVESYAFFVDGVELVRVSPVNLQAAEHDFAWTPPEAADAPPGTSFLLRVEARDFAGNVGVFEATMSVPADGPLLRANQILNPSLYTGQPVYLADGEFLVLNPQPFHQLTLLRGAVVRTEDAPGLDRVLDLEVDTTLTLQCLGRIEADSVTTPTVFAKDGGVIETPVMDVAQLTSEGRVAASELAATTRIDVSADGEIVAATLVTPEMRIADRGAVRAEGLVFDVDVSGTLTIEAEARLDSSEAGYAGGVQYAETGGAPPWVVGSEKGAGGSHGGVGTTYFNPHYAAASQGPPGGLYDSLYQPSLAGAGGAYRFGDAGDGGGFLDLAVGTLVLDGEIAARGETFSTHTDPTDSTSGAGAGGSILIRAGSLSGEGVIDASGGTNDQSGCGSLFYPATAGAGGGGRVAIYGTQTDGLASFDPATQTKAWGGFHGCLGVALEYAAPGTVLIHSQASTYGDLWIDAGINPDGSLREGPSTELVTLGSGAVSALDGQGADAWLTGAELLRPRWLGVWVTLEDPSGTALGSYRVAELDAAGRALLEGAAAAVGSAVTYRGEYHFDQLHLRNGAKLTSQDPSHAPNVVFDGGNVGIGAELVAETLTVASGTRLYPVSGSDLRLSVSGTLTLEAGATIDVTGLGYQGTSTANEDPAGAPSWVAGSVCAAGGSHGGVGSIYGYWECSWGPAGPVYGSVYEPGESGGGGGKILNADGGDGGGTITIEAGSLVLDGEVLARGQSIVEVAPNTTSDSPAAGGAGGSVLIRAGQLSGTGLIDASGGSNDQEVCPQFNAVASAGAGGGGRVGIYADTLSGFDPAAQVRAWGAHHGCAGAALGYAAPGTILTATAASTYGDLLIDAGPKPGGDAPALATFLPTLGTGAVTAAEVDGSDLWLTGDAELWPRWVGAWVSLNDAGGGSLGLFQVAERDGAGRLRLAGAAGAAAAATYQGHYIFDKVEVVGGADLTAVEPIESGTTVFDGVTEISSDVVAVDVLVKSGAVVRPAAGSDLRFEVSGTMTIEAGATVDVSARGHEGTSGAPSDPAGAPSWVPGSVCAAGGSHGGAGSIYGYWSCSWGPAGAVYGSVYEPGLAGGGGGKILNADGGDGGGTISIQAGSLVVDGQLLARGQDIVDTNPNNTYDSPAAGGAGGSILIRTAELSGTGLIDATGGTNDQTECVNFWAYASAGGGGGGRVGIYADTLSGFDPENQVRAWGGYHGCAGTPLTYAAPGTVLTFTSTSTYGSLRVDAGTKPAGQAPNLATELPALGSGEIVTLEGSGADAWLSASAVFRPRWLGAWVALEDLDGGVLGTFRVRELDAAGRLLLEGAAGVTTAASYHGIYRFDAVDAQNGATLEFADPLVGSDFEVTGTWRVGSELVATEMVIRNGATVRSAGGPSLRLDVAGRLTVEAGAKIDLSGMGYAGGDASHFDGEAPEGVRPATGTEGGAHGGATRGDFGETYGSVYLPTSLGGGGAIAATGSEAGDGGGAVILELGELVLDGEIIARGIGRDGRTSEMRNAGAGAGGSVLVDAATISGSGEINVSGGDYVRANWPDSAGSGGGGRVALFVDDLGTFSPEAQVHAYGGITVASWDWNYYFQAAAGTILVSDASATYGRLIIDAGGLQPSDPTKATELPVLGTGTVALTETAGSDAWVSAGAPFQERWLGAWMQLADSGGTPIDTYLVAELDAAGRALLADASAAAASAASYVGEYRFDEVTETGGGTMETTDPLRVGPDTLWLSVADASVDEDLGTVDVVLTLEGISPEAISVDYATADGTAAAGHDYLAASGTLQIAAGATTATLSVTVLSDAITEGDETFTLALSNPVGASLDVSTATATIVDDDPAPAPSDPDLVAYWPFDDHADPSLELTGLSVAAQLGSQAGADANDPAFQCEPNAIPSLGGNHCALDLTGDLDETTGDHLVVPNHPALDFTGAFTLSAWIRIDDTALTTYRPIFVRGADDGVTDANDVDVFTYAPTGELDVRFNRGNGGTFDEVLFTPPPQDTLFHLAIVYDGSDVRAYYDGVSQAVTGGDSALPAPLATGKPWLIGKINHGDFVAPEWGGGRVKFFDGLIDEIRFHDRALSQPEVADLAGSLQVISVTDVALAEAESSFVLTVSSSTAATEPLLIDYTTADGTAEAGLDYTLTAGTVEIPEGATSATVSVPITDDFLVEGPETFTLELSNPSQPFAIGPPAVVTILDDDVPGLPEDAGALVDFEDDAFQIVEDNPSWWLDGPTPWNGKTLADMTGTAQLKLETRPEYLHTDHKLVLGVLNDRWTGYSVSLGGWTSPVRYNSQQDSPVYHEDVEITIPGAYVTSESFEVTLTWGANSSQAINHLTGFQLYAATDDQDFQHGATYFWAGTGWSWYGGWNGKQLAYVTEPNAGTATIPMTTSTPEDAHVFYLTTLNERESAFQIQIGAWTSPVVAAPQDGGSLFVELAIDVPAGTIPAESFDVTVIENVAASYDRLYSTEARLVRKGTGSALVEYEDSAAQIVQKNPSWWLDSGTPWNGKLLAVMTDSAQLALRTRPEYLHTDHQLVLGVLNDRWTGYSIRVGDWTSPVRYNSQHQSPTHHEEIAFTIPGVYVTSEDLQVTLTVGANSTYATNYLTSYRLVANTAEQDFQRGVNYLWAGTGWLWNGDEWNRKRLTLMAANSTATIPMTTSSPQDAHVFYLTVLDDRASDFQIQIGGWTSQVVTSPQDGGSPFVELAVEIPAGTIPAASFDLAVINPLSEALYTTEARLARVPWTGGVTHGQASPVPASVNAQEDGPAGMVFTVVLSESSPVGVTIDYETAAGSALPGVDYVATSGTLTLPAGTTSASITVDLIADGISEDDETFELRLTDAQRAVLVGTVATGTILGETNAPPVAAFTASCHGLKCDLDASASTDDSGIASYEWDFGDGAVLSDSQPVSEHRFPLVKGGQFDVQLTVTDATGQQGQVTQSVTVLSTEQFVTLIKNH